MKKRMITVIAALALLMVTAASAATAGDLFPASGRGVLVRQDDGYMITGTLRGADSHFIGKVYGTLGELTTGFNTCPDFEFYCSFGGNTPTCNLLGGEVTLYARTRMTQASTRTAANIARRASIRGADSRGLSRGFFTKS
jgi:hypothetical protein